jgi:Fe-S-cluster containining protein
MVSTGNKAKLVNSEYCMKCGKCCKEFVCGGFSLDCALRFLWMKDENIKPRDSRFRNDFDDSIKREVVFNKPCSKLQKVGDKLVCSVWNKERPDFCNTYPDHCFYGIDVDNTWLIEKMLDEVSKDCPGLKETSIEEVQEMLEQHRRE